MRLRVRSDGVGPAAARHDRLVAVGLADADEVEARLRERADELEERRALLHGYVQHDGWGWDAVCRDENARVDDPERTG